MTVNVVLRLLPGPLESGDLVGHVEHVESGEVEPVRNAEELVAFARRSVTRPADADLARQRKGSRAASTR